MGKKAILPDDSYILDKLLELAYDGIVVVDHLSTITYISKTYTDFLGVEKEDVIGKNVEEVIENTRLPAVIKSGKTERAQLQMINGDYMVATRIPLIKDGAVIGAIGKVLFRNIEDLDILYKQINQLRKQVEHYRNAAGVTQAKYSFKHIIGKSEKLSTALSMAEKAGMTDSSVILTGESGTGKELFAHAIHQESARSTKPFIKINCAAIPPDLLESELFGYEEGAFTGAKKGGKIGKFEAADGGTLFLDEIGDMPPGMQAKLLRALQEREVEKIGARHPVRVDVRIIAATNRDLIEMVEKNLFRADLYYRLNVISIRIPSLRERPSDIDLLVPHLLDKICSRLGKYVEIPPETMRVLKSYSWPGNVRQLENVLERAVNLAEREAVIHPEDLPETVTGSQYGGPVSPLKESLETEEKNAIITALNLCGGKKAKAARLLKISRSNLYERMSKLSI